MFFNEKKHIDDERRLVLSGEETDLQGCFTIKLFHRDSSRTKEFALVPPQLVSGTLLEGLAAKLWEPEHMSLGRMHCFSFPRRPDPGFRCPPIRQRRKNTKESVLAAALTAAASVS